MTATKRTAAASLSPRARPDIPIEAVRRVLGLSASTPCECTALPEGRFNWCWRVKADGGRYLLKINTGQGIRHLRRLATASRRAAAAGVSVPPVERVGTDEQIGPHLVQRWIDGRTLSELLEGPDRIVVDHGVWRDLGRQVGLLHRADLPLRDRATICDRRARLRELGHLTQKAQHAGVLPAELAASITSRADVLLDVVADQVPVFSHLDVHPGNVLIAADRRVVLLDLDHAQPADPVYDFVKIQMWCAPEADRFELVRSGYRTARHLQDDDSFWASLAFYRLVNHVSYCVYWSTRDPRQIGEWISKLEEELA